MQGGHALVVERNLAAYKNVQDHAETPDVDFRSCVYLRVQELGGGKIERATERRQMVGRVIEVRETEVNYLDIPRLRN